MQVNKLLGTVLVAFAGQTQAVPSAANSTSASPSSAQGPGGIPSDTPDSDGPPRPNLICKPTGSDYCIIEICSARPPVGRLAVLYDWKCDHLGTWPPLVGLLEPSGHWSLQSRLPCTVELTLRGNDLEPQGEIWYAGRKTDLQEGWRYNCDDFSSDTECLRLSFKCY